MPYHVAEELCLVGGNTWSGEFLSFFGDCAYHTYGYERGISDCKACDVEVLGSLWLLAATKERCFTCSPPIIREISVQSSADPFNNAERLKASDLAN